MENIEIIPTVFNSPLCDNCGEPNVAIFCDEGSWCLECWNNRKEPYITPPPKSINRCKYWSEVLDKM